MNEIIIENGILKAYFGSDAIVVVPNGVEKIGGFIYVKDVNCPQFLCGDPIGYKAFYCNDYLEELYLPDSVTEIGFKALEHCKKLKLLSFSNNLKEFGINAIVGCDSLRIIIYRGTVYEFSCMDFRGQTPNLDVVYCSDGKIQFGKDVEYYIDTLHFPGTREEWDKKHGGDDWRNRRCKKIVCMEGIDHIVDATITLGKQDPIITVK